MIATRAPSPTPLALTPKQSRRANLFRWYSPKAGRLVDAESYLEFRHLLWREVDPDVVALCERPSPRIEDYVHGKSLKYTFDAWIRLRGGTELFIEVKPQSNLGSNGHPARWDLISAWCNEHGLACAWVTDVDLVPHRQLLDNWEQALAYVSLAQRSGDCGLRDEVRKLFQRESALTLSSVPGFLLREDAEHVLAEVFYLIYHRELSADLKTRPVSRALVVEWLNPQVSA